jgi:spore coat protein U-like protein
MRRSWARIALVALFAAAGLGGSPAFANGSTCLFQARGLALSFGTLNPASAANVTIPVAAATLTADKAGDCATSKTMAFTADSGLHFSGSRRMTNGTDFIPYSITLPGNQPGPGNNTYATFTFNGTILGTSYENVSAGNYSDTVTLTVTP